MPPQQLMKGFKAFSCCMSLPDKQYSWHVAAEDAELAKKPDLHTTTTAWPSTQTGVAREKIEAEPGVSMHMNGPALGSCKSGELRGQAGGANGQPASDISIQGPPPLQQQQQQEQPPAPATEGTLSHTITASTPFASSPFATAAAAEATGASGPSAAPPDHLSASKQRGSGKHLSTSQALIRPPSAVGCALSGEVLDAAGRLQQLERSLVDGVGGGIDTHKGNRKGSKSSKLGMQEPSAPGSWKGLAGSDSSRGACGEPETGSESGRTQGRSSESRGMSCKSGRSSLSAHPPCTLRRGRSLGILQPVPADQAQTHKQRRTAAAAAAAMRALSVGAVSGLTREQAFGKSASPSCGNGSRPNGRMHRVTASEANLQHLLLSGQSSRNGSCSLEGQEDWQSAGGQAGGNYLLKSTSRNGKQGAGQALVQRLLSMARSEPPHPCANGKPHTRANGRATHAENANAHSKSSSGVAELLTGRSSGSSSGKAAGSCNGGGCTDADGAAPVMAGSSMGGLRHVHSSSTQLCAQVSLGSSASSALSGRSGNAAMLLAASMEMLQGRVLEEGNGGKLPMSQSSASLLSEQGQDASFERSSSSTASGTKPDGNKGNGASMPPFPLPQAAPAPTTPDSIAKTFGEFFLKAMMTGDTKWGSQPELMCMFSNGAVLIGHDGQRYEGRAAIIRRLNTGMEQFLQMMGFNGGTSKEAQREIAARVSQVETSMEVSGLPPSASRKGQPGRNGSINGRIKPLQYSRGAVGDADSGHGIMSVILVTYTFKAGFRRFKLQDRFKVRQGQITRLQRMRA